MSSALQVLGGLGLFLLGMSLMTDGLKALAGGSLRRALARFTRSPTTGAMTGAVTTALVQSSSITVITAVGFVGAKLLTFPQALGVIFGANIGTTLTGWIVALVGFKLALDDAMLPIVFVGALLHLFGRDRLGKVGYALAGFGLVFVGITMLQSGMAAAEHLVSPQTFPSDTFTGRLQLVLIGGLITLVTQSSSAGVATAIAAVSAGAISFPQAAAMVIGMDVGTTVTAALATIGGNASVRRTGLAHVVYNVLTGIVAFALLSPYTWVLNAIDPTLLTGDPELSLVGYHTFFNGLGVVLVLPFAGRFARLVEKLFPEDESELLRHLSKRLRKDAFLALVAVRSTIIEISLRLFDGLDPLLRVGDNEKLREMLPEIKAALRAVDNYLSEVQTSKQLGMTNDAHLAVLHALDHLKLLVVLCDTEKLSLRRSETQELREVAAETLVLVGQSLIDGESSRAAAHDGALRLASVARETRHKILSASATGAHSVEATSAILERVRWLNALGEHAHKVHHYMLEFPLATGGDKGVDEE
jgi:phosphate:Na+ symporter